MESRPDLYVQKFNSFRESTWRITGKSHLREIISQKYLKHIKSWLEYCVSSNKRPPYLKPFRTSMIELFVKFGRSNFYTRIERQIHRDLDLLQKHKYWAGKTSCYCKQQFIFVQATNILHTWKRSNFVKDLYKQRWRQV